MKKYRYEWKKKTAPYSSSIYNFEDRLMHRTFTVIDTDTSQEYEFPNYSSFLNTDNCESGLNIDADLKNSEFLDWLFSTSLDFDIGNLWTIGINFMTDELFDTYIENTKNFVYLMDRVKVMGALLGKSSDEMKEVYIKVLAREPNLFNSLPAEKSLHNKEAYREFLRRAPGVANYLSLLFLKENVDDVFKEIIRDGDDVALSGLPDRFLKYVSDDSITDEVASKLVEVNSRFIKFIPEDRVTLAMAYRAVNSDVKNLEFVPDSLVNSELCDFAFDKDKRSFKYFPLRFKTRDKAISAVIFDRRLFKTVPVGILDQGFIDELSLIDVRVPASCAKYVKECLKTQEKLTLNEPLEIGDVASHGDFLAPGDNILLEELASFFSKGTLSALRRRNINTLNDLFKVFGNGEIAYLPIGKVVTVRNITNLLQCKYLGKDPLIDINDSSMRSFIDKLGIDCNYNSQSLFEQSFLVRKYETPNELLQAVADMGKETFLDTLSNSRNIGSKTGKQIYARLEILIDYYKIGQDKQQRFSIGSEPTAVKSQDNESNNQQIQDLFMQLKSLREQRNAIDKQIDTVITRIQEKVVSKGGSK